MKKEGTNSICEICGKIYYVSPSYRDKRKTCSKDCYAKLTKTWLCKDLRERFYAKVKKTESCWLWTGAMLKTGYGSIRINKKAERAHRVAYELEVGEIPAGMLLRHTCDTPRCVNPAHLIPGTKRDNSKDALDRGQHLVGERSPKAKLSNDDVSAIRTLLANGATGRYTAKLFGVTEGHISLIKNWKHRVHG
jgi:hypothetical protein